MKIQVLRFTKNPLTTIGECARRCWNSPPGREVEIAMECIASNHGRVLEFADLTIEISECSARVMREIYTHIVGTSRLQESTRYVDMVNFDYIVPKSIQKDDRALSVYHKTMESIRAGIRELKKIGIPRQDYANLVPLGSHSKMVLKINVRALLHMANERMCSRAYWEFRDFMSMLTDTIRKLDNEWACIAGLMVPKCDVLGYCPEKYSCGRYPKRGD